MSTELKEVRVIVSGGVVQHVDVPAGVIVHVIDYDVDGGDDVAELDMVDGEECRIATWGMGG